MPKADPKLLEMAEVFHIPAKAKLKYIILPALKGETAVSPGGGSGAHQGGGADASAADPQAGCSGEGGDDR